MRRSGIALLALGFAVVAPSVAAYRFALEYRRRAGFPARRPLLETPAAHGMAFEDVTVPSDAGPLPGWFVPAPGGRAAPAVVLVHGWESNRARMLPHAAFLHAAGFATLMFDVRGHGDNPPELLPISAPEFGADTLAAVGLVATRPDITAVAVLGHSMGAIGAAIAAADDPRTAALVLTSTPADPRRMVRRTFQLAGLRLPGPVAHPLAALSMRVLLRPRGHRPAAASASSAVGRYPGPVLIIHGALDEVVGAGDAIRLERAARRVAGRDVDVMIMPGARHRWLFEDPAYRGRIAAFLARHLPGAPEPVEAAARAMAVSVVRQPDTNGQFSALERPTVEPAVGAARRPARSTAAAAAGPGLA